MANVLEKIRAFDGHITKIAALESRIAELEAGNSRVAELEAALAEGAVKLAEIDTLKAEITGYRSQITTLQAVEGELKEKLSTTSAAAAAAASIQIGTAIGATMGIPAALAPAVEATKDKPDFTSLRGVEKVIAIERWEASQRNNVPKN